VEQAEQLGQQIGMRRACVVLGISHHRVYRHRHPAPSVEKPRKPSPRALSAAERDRVLQTLNAPRFQDQAPREIYATLLGEQQYLGHWRTFYRILASAGPVRERRDQLRHPHYVKPELLATGPNQVWSWDITKLLGPYKWTYFYLYVILDIYSRYVVGWTIALQEAGYIAEELVADSYIRHAIQPGQLTLHADRGIPMVSKPLAFLLADLGVTKTHSRPSVSNDNPFSEAQFKTLKYRPDYPARFGSRLDAEGWAQGFFPWYNTEHHHTALALLTPAEVHFGRASEVLQARQTVLERAYAAHPERFVKGLPKAGQLPAAVWINPPQKEPNGDPG
jgi:putative transposase